MLIQASSLCTYISNSKKLPVCNNHQIYENKDFSRLTTGARLYGLILFFKLHLVIIQHIELVKFLFRLVNVANKNQQMLQEQLQILKGKCYGNRDYLSSLFEISY